MKRRYSPAHIVRHGVMYLAKILIPQAFRSQVWRFALRLQNSVPIYLLLKRGDVAVQVGTPNVVTVRRFSNFVGKEGKVVIVEADPVNAEKIQDSLLTFKHKNVEVINMGAWHSKDTLTLQKSDLFDGDHRFKVDDVFIDNDLRTKYPDSVTVDVDQLDNILRDLSISTLDYLSVTVNGAELEVLKGASNVLEKSKNLKVFSKGHARLGGADSHSTINLPIQKYLQRHGYIAVISKGELSPTGEAGWGRRAGDVFAWKQAK